jgi:antitoxin VapB
MELPGDEAVIHREGEKLILEPVARRSLLEVLANLKPLYEEMTPIDELPIEPVSV